MITITVSLFDGQTGQSLGGVSGDHVRGLLFLTEYHHKAIQGLLHDAASHIVLGQGAAGELHQLTWTYLLAQMRLELIREVYLPTPCYEYKVAYRKKTTIVRGTFYVDTGSNKYLVLANPPVRLEVKVHQNTPLR